MKHFLIVDLEATCSNDGTLPREEMEIIEIGAVMVSADTHQPLGEFQSFVRPVRHPELTEFCRELTHISQQDVDAAAGYALVLTKFLEWATEFHPFVFCSWGNYDRSQFQIDCDFHGIEYPFGDVHINLKAEFAVAHHRKKMGLPAALSSVGLEFSGSHHRGIDDARNIARLIPHIYPATSGSRNNEQC